MNCQQFDDRLQLLLDNRVTPESDIALVEHAEDCTSCRQILLTQARLFKSFKGEDDSKTNAPAIADLELLSSCATQDRLGFSSEWAGRIAVAICLSIALSLGVRLMAPQDAGVVNSNVATTNSLTPSKPGATSSIDNPGTVETTESRPARIASEGYEVDWTLVAASFAQSAKLPDERPEWVTRVAGEFQPVAESVQSALSVLRRSALPVRSTRKSEPQASVLRPIALS